jgi:hypothetical protein
MPCEIHASQKADSLGRVTRCWRTLVVAAAALSLVLPAAAQNPPEEPPPGVSSIDQYIEQIPTSRGSRVAGAGDGKGQPLSRKARRALREQGGPDAAALERIATSPAYGAPERPLRKSRELVRTPSDDDPSLAAALSAAVSAPGEGGGWRLGVLAVVLLATTVGLAAVAYRQRG